MAKDVFATTPKVTVINEPITSPPVAQQVRIYHKDGSSQNVFPVDAKEAVAGGEYSYDPPAVPPPTETAAALDLEAMTKSELQSLADERGVHLATGITKAEMIDALNAGGK